MKIENLDRVIVAQQELKNLDQAIAEFGKIKENTGVILTEHRDGSGFRVDLQYKDGNYHPMYKDILEFVRVKFVEARLELLKEISEL